MNYSEACSILEVPEKSSEETIRKSFKKLAVKYHPDRNKEEGAEQKAKEVSEAFSVLEKLKFQPPVQKMENPFSGFNRKVNFHGGFPFVDDIPDFMDFIRKNFDDMAESNVKITLDLSFKESILGTTKEISYQRIEPCSVCTDKNFKRSSEDGYINYCNNCNTDSTKENPGVKSVTQNKKISIPGGVRPGMTISIPKAGSWNKDSKKFGDIIIIPQVTPDPKLSLENNDIVSTEEITLLQALEGGEVEIDYIQGKHKLKLPHNVKNHQKVTLRNQGVPGRGNHIITFKVKYPEDTSKLITFLKENQ